MTRWSSKAIPVLVLMLTACQSISLDDIEGDSKDEGNVTLAFAATEADTKGSVYVGDYFTKLNVMLFDADGQKALSQTKTQTSVEDGFGIMSLNLAPGAYTVVAVGHSSVKSATIKSPSSVQFTASEGSKLTDTFCHTSIIEVNEDEEQFGLLMSRATAMFRLVLTDEVPDNVVRMKFDYKGGSANFNPQTMQGTTKSTQSELRTLDNLCIYTFPYLAVSCTLTLTVSALDAQGTVVCSRTFNDILMTRNRITTYRGQFFDGTEGETTQTGMGFTVEGEWDGEDIYEF